MDTTKKRLQAQVLQNTLSGQFLTGRSLYSGWLHCIRSVLATEGVSGLYRGIVPTVMKSSLSVGVTFFTFEGCHRCMAGREGLFGL
jgi:hypothetical protein